MPNRESELMEPIGTTRGSVARKVANIREAGSRVDAAEAWIKREAVDLEQAAMVLADIPYAKLFDVLPRDAMASPEAVRFFCGRHGGVRTFGLAELASVIGEGEADHAE